MAAADLGQFQGAADDLEVTQQAVSKRIASLERELGVRLLIRTARGAALTVDGQAFLPHARALIHAAERAVAAVRPGQRPLRVDVPGRRFGPARLLRAFHDTRPGAELDVITLWDVIADSADVATFVGEQMRVAWPAGYDLRRIPIRDPSVPYPHSLIWHAGNPHPVLAALREHVTAARAAFAPNDPRWLPPWTPRDTNAPR